MIGRAITESSLLVYLKKPDLRSAALVAVADDGNRISRNQHFVIPRSVRINVRRETRQPSKSVAENCH